MGSPDYPVLSFVVEFDDKIAVDVEQKGFFDHAIVTLEDGSQYRLHFYDPERLAFELKLELSHGNACIAEPGLVVVPRVTPDNVRKAVEQMAKDGYFALKTL